MSISDNKIQQPPIAESSSSCSSYNTDATGQQSRQMVKQQAAATTAAHYHGATTVQQQSGFQLVTQAYNSKAIINNTKLNQRPKPVVHRPPSKQQQASVASTSQNKTHSNHISASTTTHMLSTKDPFEPVKAKSAQAPIMHQPPVTAAAASSVNNKTAAITTKMSSVNYAYSDNLLRKRKSRTPFECIICLNDFKTNIPHCTEKCDHQVCRECIRKYFSTAVKDPHRYNTFELLPCPSPGCSEYFVTDEQLAYFFSKAEVKRWWNSALTNAYIANKVKCPLKGCNGIFDVDTKDLKKCAFTECLECHRGFCIACQTPWHPGEVRIVDDEEELIKTLKMAEQSKWCRCPKCSRIVEKVSGCSTMRCYCGTYFCYRCGGISDDHFCRNHCQDMNQEQLKVLRSAMFVQH